MVLVKGTRTLRPLPVEPSRRGTEHAQWGGAAILVPPDLPTRGVVQCMVLGLALPLAVVTPARGAESGGRGEVILKSEVSTVMNGRCVKGRQSIWMVPPWLEGQLLV